MRPENENIVLVYLYSEQTSNVHIKVGSTFAHCKMKLNRLNPSVPLQWVSFSHLTHVSSRVSATPTVPLTLPATSWLLCGVMILTHAEVNPSASAFCSVTESEDSHFSRNSRHETSCQDQILPLTCDI